VRLLSKEAPMKVGRLAALTVPLTTAAFFAVTTVSALAKDAEVPAWQDGHAHGFDGCLTQEATDPPYFDLVNAKSDDGTDVGTVRLTGFLQGINPKDSLNKRVHVTGVYLGREPTDPGSRGHIEMTDDARPAEGECP
jgi:hypothetical protein